MPNSVTLIKGPGGLGRPLDGQDFISGYIHYTSVLPSGFTSSARIQEIFSVTDAENLGITDTHIGEVRATASFAVTGAGSPGNSIAVLIGGTPVATYTVQTGDTTNTINYALAQLINSSTSGYTSNGSTASATAVLTAPAGSGIFPNTVATNVTVGGTVSATIGTLGGGVYSEIDIMHYHISEYFRAQPQGDLYVGVYPNSTDFAEITTMQNFADGKIRQVGIYKSTAFATSQTADIQTQLDLCELNNKPLEAIYQPDFISVTNLNNLSDLHTLQRKMFLLQ